MYIKHPEKGKAFMSKILFPEPENKEPPKTSSINSKGTGKPGGQGEPKSTGVI